MSQFLFAQLFASLFVDHQCLGSKTPPHPSGERIGLNGCPIWDNDRAAQSFLWPGSRSVARQPWRTTSPRPSNHFWMAPASRETHSSTDHQPAHRRRTMRLRLTVPPRWNENDRWRFNKWLSPSLHQWFFLLLFLHVPKQEFEVPLTEPVSDRMHARCRLSVTAVKRQRRDHTHARNIAHAGHLWRRQRHPMQEASAHVRKITDQFRVYTDGSELAIPLTNNTVLSDAQALPNEEASTCGRTWQPIALLVRGMFRRLAIGATPTLTLCSLHLHHVGRQEARLCDLSSFSASATTRSAKRSTSSGAPSTSR